MGVCGLKNLKLTHIHFNFIWWVCLYEEKLWYTTVVSVGALYSRCIIQFFIQYARSGYFDGLFNGKCIIQFFIWSGVMLESFFSFKVLCIYTFLCVLDVSTIYYACIIG